MSTSEFDRALTVKTKTSKLQISLDFRRTVTCWKGSSRAFVEQAIVNRSIKIASSINGVGSVDGKSISLVSVQTDYSMTTQSKANTGSFFCVYHSFISPAIQRITTITACFVVCIRYHSNIEAHGGTIHCRHSACALSLCIPTISYSDAAKVLTPPLITPILPVKILIFKPSPD